MKEKIADQASLRLLFFCLLSHEFDIDINLFGRKENLEETVGMEAILIGTISSDLHEKRAGFVGSTGRAL